MRRFRPPTPTTPTGLTRSRHANANPPAMWTATAYLLLAPLATVIDADAINAIASRPEILRNCPGERILTPHPGEMARLDPESAKRSRRDTVKAFTQRYPCTLLLKGARTIVGQSGKPFSYNTTGTPGMATGGNGDVLTGVIVALVGQRVPPYDAARLGAWLCGRASELAIGHGVGATEDQVALAHCNGHAAHSNITEELLCPICDINLTPVN